MEQERNKRKREQEGGPGAFEEPAGKRSCDSERSPSPQPSTSGSQLLSVQPERRSSSQLSTAGPRCVGPRRGGPHPGGPRRGGLLSTHRWAQERRRRLRRQVVRHSRNQRLLNGLFDVDVIIRGPRPIVNIPSWVPASTANEVMAEVESWWSHSPLSPEMKKLSRV